MSLHKKSKSPIQRKTLPSTHELPLRLEGNLIIGANNRRICAIFDWYEDGGVEISIPKEEVSLIGELIINSLNTGRSD